MSNNRRMGGIMLHVSRLGLTAGGEPALLANQLGHTLAFFIRHNAKWITNDKDQDAIEAAFGERVGAEVGAADD